MAGRPKGSPNKQKCQPFRDALRIELAAAGENRKSLRDIAKKLIETAAGGDVAAIRQIADRLDGKPAQAVEMSVGLAISHEEALAELD